MKYYTWEFLKFDFEYIYKCYNLRLFHHNNNILTSFNIYMPLFIKNHIMNKENLFYKHVNEYNYNLQDDNEGDKIDYEIYEMFNHY